MKTPDPCTSLGLLIIGMKLAVEHRQIDLIVTRGLAEELAAKAGIEATLGRCFSRGRR